MMKIRKNISVYNKNDSIGKCGESMNNPTVIDCFKRGVGKAMQVLELAGITNNQTKSAIKRTIWQILDDVNLKESSYESKEINSKS